MNPMGQKQDGRETDPAMVRQEIRPLRKAECRARAAYPEIDCPLARGPDTGWADRYPCRRSHDSLGLDRSTRRRPSPCSRHLPKGTDTNRAHSEKTAR